MFPNGTSLAEAIQTYSPTQNEDCYIKHTFPHGMASSVQKLIDTTELSAEPTEWYSCLKDSVPSLEIINTSINFFKSSKCKNVYEFMLHVYFPPDMLGLYAVSEGFRKSFLKVHQIDFIVEQLFTLSKLSFFTYFIEKPTHYIFHHAFHQQTSEALEGICLNSICGGYTACSSLGVLGGGESVISSQFKYKEFLEEVDTDKYPSFSNLECKDFDKSGEYIHALDFRSLYPSAEQCAMPCLNGVLLNPIPITQSKDFNTRKKQRGRPILQQEKFCSQILNTSYNTDELCFLVVNSKPPIHRIEEFKVVRWFIRNVIEPSYLEDFEVKHVGSASHTGGQRKFGTFFCDLIVCLESKKVLNEKLVILFDYHGRYFHGHEPNCVDYFPEPDKENRTREKSERLISFLDILNNINGGSVKYEYRQMWSCDFPNHLVPYHVDDLMIEDILKIRHRLTIPYDEMMNLLLHNSNKEWVDSFFGKIPPAVPRGISGFLVLYGGEVSYDPIQGQIISKVNLTEDMLSDCQREKLAKYNLPLSGTCPKVIATNSIQGITVMHTATWRKIHESGGWVKKPKILHILLFKNGNLLSQIIYSALKQRQEIKHAMEIEKNHVRMISLNVQQLVIKYTLNMSYGFLILNLNKGPYTSCKMVKASQSRRVMEAKKRLYYEDRLGNKNGIVKIFRGRTSNKLEFSPLSCVGASVLSLSKIILLDGINFLNSHMDPRYFCWVYTDTDSIHCVTHYKDFASNVASHMKDSWEVNSPAFFDDVNRVSGMLITEKIARYGCYYGEKLYQLFSSDQGGLIASGTKGIPKSLETKLDINTLNAQSCVTQTRMVPRRDVGVFFQNTYRYIGKSNVLLKRKCLDNFTSSVPLKVKIQKPDYVLIDKSTL